MADKIRWGILGTGRIAHLFAEGLRALPDAEIVAVGSRAADTAHAFADKHGIPHRHTSYEALANDPAVDVVYVSTLHHLHHANTLLCLNAGKAVLCEKPFAINAKEAQAMVALARQKGIFLMEAMWTRFLPAIVKVRKLLADGAIGVVRMVVADFGYRAEVKPESRIFNPQWGGGALLDVGVYTISFASMVLGTPQRIASMVHLNDVTGVDEQGAMIFGYAGGQLALLSSAVRTATAVEVIIYGTDGYIRVHSPFYRATRFTLTAPGGRKEEYELPYRGNGYSHEAEEVMRCLRDGKLESSIMPLDETLSIMQTMDQIRAQWGLKYPME